jgi:glutamate-ammonia-ligase adenylyltransferase
MVEQYLIVQGPRMGALCLGQGARRDGHAEDIAALDAIVRPFVFRRYLDFGVIDAIRNMHAQIRAEVNRQERLHPDRSNNVKLGRGGIREIEFLAQVFQLIRGGRDAALRDRSTRTTLRIIAEKGLLSHAIVYQLLASYTFLRNLEHRLQYLDDAQTHTLPANEADRPVAQMMGCRHGHPAGPAGSAPPVRRRPVRRNVLRQEQTSRRRSRHAINPQVSDACADPDNREAMVARFAALGFDDAAGAAQRLIGTWQAPRLQSLPEASRNRLLGLINRPCR